MGAMAFVAKKLKSPGLLVPGRKPVGRVVVDHKKRPKYLAGFMPLVDQSQGNILGGINTENNPLERVGDYWSAGSGSQAIKALVDKPLTDFPVVLQAGFLWNDTGNQNVINLCSVSNYNAGFNRILFWYDDLGHNRFALSYGQYTYWYNYTPVVGEYYVVEAVFISTGVSKIRVNKVISNDINSGSGAFPSYDLNEMSIGGQWYSGSYFDSYPVDRIDWFAAWGFAGSGLSETEILEHCDRFSADPYAILTPAHDLWLPSSSAGIQKPALLLVNGKWKQYDAETPNAPLCINTNGSIQAYTDVTGKNPLVHDTGDVRVLAGDETLQH